MLVGLIARARVTVVPAAILVASCSGPAPAGNQQVKPDFIEMDMMTMKGGKGLYVANRDGTITEIPFALDLQKIDPERGHDSEQIGQTDVAVVMFDRYATRAAPEDACFDPQKGREAFVRVFSLELRREIFSRAVASCRDGVTAANPQVTWVGHDSFRIEGKRPQTFRITGADRVDAVP
jgi:hypothetical protein